MSTAATLRVTTTTCITWPGSSALNWGRRWCCSPPTGRAFTSSAVAPLRSSTPRWTLVQVSRDYYINQPSVRTIGPALTSATFISLLIAELSVRLRAHSRLRAQGSMPGGVSRSSWSVCVCFPQASNITAAFAAQRLVEPHGPLVNMSHRCI